MGIRTPDLLNAIEALYQLSYDPFDAAEQLCNVPSSKPQGNQKVRPRPVAAKPVQKSRHAAKVKRRHDKPGTPCNRELESPHSVPARTKMLRGVRAHEALARRQVTHHVGPNRKESSNQPGLGATFASKPRALRGCAAKQDPRGEILVLAHDPRIAVGGVSSTLVVRRWPQIDIENRGGCVALAHHATGKHLGKRWLEDESHAG